MVPVSWSEPGRMRFSKRSLRCEAVNREDRTNIKVGGARRAPRRQHTRGVEGLMLLKLNTFIFFKYLIIV